MSSPISIVWPKFAYPWLFRAGRYQLRLAIRASGVLDRDRSPANTNPQPEVKSALRESLGTLRKIETDVHGLTSRILALSIRVMR